jgi:hypothetical protein
MSIVTVHVGPATLLVGGGLGAYDTNRHGGKGKICFFFISSYFSNYKPRGCIKHNSRRLRSALLKLKPAKQCCGARAEEVKLIAREPEPKLRITAPNPDHTIFIKVLKKLY